MITHAKLYVNGTLIPHYFGTAFYMTDYGTRSFADISAVVALAMQEDDGSLVCDSVVVKFPMSDWRQIQEEVGLDVRLTIDLARKIRLHGNGKLISIDWKREYGHAMVAYQLSAETEEGIKL